MESELKLELVGIRDMLMHNGRLANPLDPYTRAIGAIAKKRNKTDDDLAELAQIEARGGMYETEDGLLGLPVNNLWRCLYDASKAFKLGEDCKRALIPSPDVVPLMIDGHHQKCDTYLSEHEDRLSYESVVIQRRRLMRARTIIPKGWSATVTMMLLSDVLPAERLVPVLERAGRLIGLGDHRPMYGTFEGTMT